MQPRRRAVRRLSLPALLVGAVVLAVAMALPAHAQRLPRTPKQDLAKVYRDARMQVLIDQIFREQGARVEPLPPARVPAASDTLAAWIARRDPNYRPPQAETGLPSRIVKWRLIERGIERRTFEKQFNEVKWAYLGNNYFTPVDTTFTREIRARMQAAFGAPTKTLAEVDLSRPLRRGEYIQFEYWFILNDSIPMIVMDVSGPFDRGVVVACDQAYREVLFDLRQSFLGRIMEGVERAPYVDYYYHYPARRWYRTGFDGRRYFQNAIGAPNLARGRPQLAPPGG